MGCVCDAGGAVDAAGRAFAEADGRSETARMGTAWPVAMLAAAAEIDYPLRFRRSSGAVCK
jgi:hypothetical protein